MNTLTPAARDFLRLHRELATVQEANRAKAAEMDTWPSYVSWLEQQTARIPGAAS